MKTVIDSTNHMSVDKNSTAEEDFLCVLRVRNMLNNEVIACESPRQKYEMILLCDHVLVCCEPHAAHVFSPTSQVLGESGLAHSDRVLSMFKHARNTMMKTDQFIAMDIDLAISVIRQELHV